MDNTASYGGVPGQISSAAGGGIKQAMHAAAYQGGPASPGPAVTMVDLINRSGSLLERIRDLAQGVDNLNDRLTGPSPQMAEAKLGSATSAMPGSLGEMAHLLHLQHATLDRIEAGLRRLHELQG